MWANDCCSNLPSTVRQDVMFPPLQLVRTAHGIKDLLARLQAQVVRVVQAEAAARVLELLGPDALQGGLGRHGHEHGKVDRAMGQGEDGGASSGRLSLVRFHLSVRGSRLPGCQGGRRRARRRGVGGGRGVDIGSLTEHLATRSKVSAPWVADLLVVDAILLTIHILLPPRACWGGQD